MDWTYSLYIKNGNSAWNFEDIYLDIDMIDMYGGKVVLQYAKYANNTKPVSYMNDWSGALTVECRQCRSIVLHTSATTAVLES